MSGAHCARFPACMEFSEQPKAPSCDKPDCPGAATWARFFPAVAETDADAQRDDGLLRDSLLNNTESGER